MQWSTSEGRKYSSSVISREATKMDSKCKAWKLRNSTEIWRPNKHALNNNNSPVGRGKLSASDTNFNFPAMTRDNRKSLQAKWNSSTTSFQHTSNVGSTSSSPILRCRTVSPDLCRARSVNRVKISESVPQPQGKSNITNPENAEVVEYVLCASPEPKSSTDTIMTQENIAPLNIWVDNHQRPRHSITSSWTALASQKRVVGRSASVSPQMWQEKKSVTTNTTEGSVVACKQGKSPHGAGPLRITKKQENDAKNKCFPQSLDVFFAPSVPLPYSTRLQRTIGGKGVPPSPVDQTLLPLRQDPEDIQNELVLCSSRAFSNKISCKKETSPCVVDTAHLNQDALTGSSLRSAEQCVMMRMNMAFEPGVKPSTPCKSYHLEPAWSSTTLREPVKKEMIPSEVAKHTTQPERHQANMVSHEPEDELRVQSCNHDLQTVDAMFSSNASETLKSTDNACEMRATELNCEAADEHPSTACETTEENFAVIEAQVSPRGRRWPKLQPSISDRSHIVKLATSLTASSSKCPPEEGASKSVGCQKSAVNSTRKVHGEVALPYSKGVVGTSQDEDSCSLRATDQRTEKSRDGLPSRDSPTTDTNSNNGVLCIRSEKPPEKAVVRSSDKLSEDILPAFSSKTDFESKAGVFSSKSKRSLKRATLAIIEKKRRDENSQWFTPGETEFKPTDARDKILSKAEATSTEVLKNREMEQNEESDSSPQRSLKMKRMTISGPADAFREIRVDRTGRPLDLSSMESASPDSHMSSTGGPHLEAANVLRSSTQQRDSTCNLQVLEPSEQAAGCFNLQDLGTMDNLIEHSGSVVRLGDDRVSNSPSPGICNNIRPRSPSEVISQEEERLSSDGISKMWSSPLHQEAESADRASLSSEKFSSILSYLGHVEESNLQDNFKFLRKRDLVQEGTSVSLKGSQSPCTVLEHEDSVSLANSTLTTSLTNISSTQSRDGDVGVSPATSLFEGVRKKMQEFRSKIAAKESQNAELLRDIGRLTTDKEQALSLERDRFGRELEVRAAEYKAAIQHHLDLNEKMVKDKESLSEKCCNLAGILSTVESKYEDKMKVLKEQFAQELKKQKEIWIAGEKPRREAWKEKKIKEIKELTIKGLEPHIDGLNEKHRQESKRLEMRFADETQKKLEVQSLQHRQEMCELRSRLLKERDEIVEKERLAVLTRLNDVAEKYEHQAMELRRKVSGDMAAELEKVEEARRRDKQVAHDVLSRAREEWNNREAALKNTLEKHIQHAVAEKDTEILSLRSELESLKNDWQKNFDEKLRKVLQVQEEEFKSRCTKERDEQIEMIIERMESEKDEAIAQHQQELLAKVETLMEEKLELMKKLKEVESKCAKLCKFSLEAKQKAEMATATQDLQVESLRREVSSQVDLIEQLKAQIQQEKKNLRQQEQRYDFRVAKEHELVQAKQLEMERCNEETKQLRLRKAKELEEVETHVRQAIENKDQIIAGLREQLIAAREQIRHTQLLLQQEHVAFLADPD